MRVSREQAAENRVRILEVASRLFREKGFDGIGLVDIMKAAGLTHGGFYGHFKSKLDLEAEASRAALDKTRLYWQKQLDNNPDDPFGTLVDRYLTASQRDNPGAGCAFAALAPDATRHGEGVQNVFSEGLEQLIDMIAKVMPEADEATRRTEALSAISEMIGAQILARMVRDGDLSDDILEASKLKLRDRCAP
ncbi:TetR/AcrR family transcriptional regulator [Thalassospira sp.]|uniref:TetR/AcrR family transcriptional regulator n=1 Tax=Thalassospira sp. TaxID=1912094 RepID=UPI003AA97A2D